MGIQGSSEYDSIVRIVSQYAVQIICGIYIIYVYWHFMRKLFISTSNISDSRTNLIKQSIGRLKWFPIIYFICYIPGIINRFMDIFNFDEKAQIDYVMTFVHFAALSANGLLDALIYSWTWAVKKIYKRICAPWPQHENSLNVIWALYSALDETEIDDSTSTAARIAKEKVVKLKLMSQLHQIAIAICHVIFAPRQN